MATRWAICGAGKISHDFCKCLNSLPKTEHQIVAVAARDSEKAANFAREFNIPQSYGSYEELCHVQAMDIIYIGTIHPYHVETCLMYINAGKNVLCEKPMAQTLRGCQRVLSAAKEKGVFFMEGWWSRFFPVFNFLKEQVLDQGLLGEIKILEASFCGVGLTPERLAKWELGGGALVDVGVYGIHAAHFFFPGKPSVVKAEAAFTEQGFDKSAAVILKYPGGQLACITTSFETQYAACSMTIRGTKGNIVIPERMWCPTQLYHNGKLTEFSLPEVSDTKPFNFPNGAGMVYEIQAVRDCLLKGLKECPLVSHEHSETVMWILEETLKELGIKYK